ncbi:MAG: TrmH family RNA methyltransferase, partial [Oscillospiraceae bacterium]|nr:TrmH family RNA methyltransferase [Oscillospiraceae bacterium]
MKEIIKPYKKEFDYSYTSGAYATIELLKARPDCLQTVYLHSDFYEKEKIADLCAQNNLSLVCSDMVFKRVNQKENSYVLGLFKKYPSAIRHSAPHVVLVNPGDMGNLGTIIRTLAGSSIRDLALITPAADIWNPKTIRASMGSLFHINFQHFGSMDDYQNAHPRRQIFTFMLDGT